MAQAFQSALIVEHCCSCGVAFGLDQNFYNECRKDSTKWFYCPGGHRQHYSDSETDKLRRERDRLAQRVAEKDDTIRHKNEVIEHRDRSLATTRGHITRIKRRVGSGVCPCCNRSFPNLLRHMHTKHPSYEKEAIA